MARVETGLHRLLRAEGVLDGLRVGLLANPTCVTEELRHGLDALLERGIDIVRLFAPEHGIRAAAQDMEAVDQTADPLTGIPTVSLYGETADSLRPAADSLRDLDLLLADIQDVGARYYTYASTVGLAMDVCGEVGTEVWVLDRPNPLGGRTVEGNLVAPDLRSFVGTQPIPNRHGMTLGELARFYDRYGGWSCDLTVIEMRGWERSMWFDETGLPWVMPSPNMPTLETAVVYPGMCLLEGTNASEGRGTTRPFELFGAPWADGHVLRDHLEGLGFEGVHFRATAFRPMFQKHAGETCHGVQIHVADRDAYRSTAVGYAAVRALAAEWPGAFDWRREPYEFVDDELAIDLLVGDRDLRRAIQSGEEPSELSRAARADREPFAEQRRDCLLY